MITSSSRNLPGVRLRVSVWLARPEACGQRDLVNARGGGEFQAGVGFNFTVCSAFRVQDDAGGVQHDFWHAEGISGEGQIGSGLRRVESGDQAVGARFDKAFEIIVFGGDTLAGAAIGVDRVKLPTHLRIVAGLGRAGGEQRFGGDVDV